MFGVPSITVEELKEKQDRGEEITLLDVRSAPHTFRRGLATVTLTNLQKTLRGMEARFWYGQTSLRLCPQPSSRMMKLA